jgi:hypothetical protein
MSVVNTQNYDGGFAESLDVRPRNIKNINKLFMHFISRPRQNKFEVLRRIISIQRPKHNRIHTHWTNYSRHWYESNLWDSWFRVLLLARIETYFNAEKFNEWGFINFPGIGYHHHFNLKAS